MEARSTKQARGSKKKNRGQKQLIWLSNKISLGPAHQKKSPQGPENTQASPSHFLCTQVQKKSEQVQKTCTGPKKGAQVQKTCIPYTKPRLRVFTDRLLAKKKVQVLYHHRMVASSLFCVGTYWGTPHRN